jgi:hypothetical protein
MTDKVIHFGGQTNFTNFIRTTLYDSAIVELIGYDKVSIGSRSNRDSLMVDTDGIKTDSITIGDNTISKEQWGYLASVTRPINFIGSTLQKKFLSQSHSADFLYSYNISSIVYCIYTKI